MASIAYSRTMDRSVVLHSTVKGFQFFLVCSETKLSIPSVDRLVKDMNITLTPNQSLNAAANQLDIFQFAANLN